MATSTLQVEFFIFLMLCYFRKSFEGKYYNNFLANFFVKENPQAKYNYFITFSIERIIIMLSLNKPGPDKVSFLHSGFIATLYQR